MNIPHPLPYQGSKRQLAPIILRYFPRDVTRLVEPFAGSGAVSLAALANGKVQHVFLNDLNAPLIALLKNIMTTPETLAAQYELLWHMQQGQERGFYDEIRQQFNQTHRPDYLLYLLARCVKAAVRYNANGEFNQSPDNRRKGAKPATMRKQILGAATLLRGKTHLAAKDYRDILADIQENDLIYFDPPYQGVSGKRDPRYLSHICFEEFMETLSELNRRNIAYLVSYDGKSGEKSYGKPLPASLKLKQIALDAGRSSQATLLGRHERTTESLYLSPMLIERLGMRPKIQPYSLHMLYV